MSRTTVTRAELHEMVWARPLRAVAKDLGVSDVGLSKICKRNGVPTPPQGHWTRVHLGKAVSTIPLPEAPSGVREPIDIMSWQSRLPVGAAEEVARLRSELREAHRSIEREDAPVSPRTFRLQGDPRTVLRPTVKALRRAKADREGCVKASGDGLCGLEVRPEDVDRVVGLLDALVGALEAREIAFAPVGNAMRISRGADAATFKIKAKREWRPYEPTDAERLTEERRLRRLEREQKLGVYTDWSLRQRTYPENIHAITGAYALGVEGWADGARKTWADGKMQTLESMFDGIVIGLDAYLVAVKARREEHEERQRTWARAERLRRLAEKRKEREDRRVEYVSRIIAQEGAASDLRRWMSNLREPDTGDLEQYRRMIAWARARLLMLEAKMVPSEIERDLRKLDLFPAIDPLVEPADD